MRYTVKKGDNLWLIAKEQMGSSEKWTTLYHWNSNVIGPNPNILAEGIEIWIPLGVSPREARERHKLLMSGVNLKNVALHSFLDGVAMGIVIIITGALIATLIKLGFDTLNLEFFIPLVIVIWAFARVYAAWRENK